MTRKRQRRIAAVTVATLAGILGSCGDARDTSGENPGPGTGTKLAGGQELYERTCAQCYGEGLDGTDIGLPFLHPVYAPDHHPDEAFYAAVANGVTPHHWDFGAMPAYPGLDGREVEAIVA